MMQSSSYTIKMFIVGAVLHVAHSYILLRFLYLIQFAAVDSTLRHPPAAIFMPSLMLGHDVFVGGELTALNYEINYGFNKGTAK